MVFTPENLIENMDKLGPWSARVLFEEAMEHYFPEEWGDGPKDWLFLELPEQLGCETWQDVVRKYHTEIGYSTLAGIDEN